MQNASICQLSEIPWERGWECHAGEVWFCCSICSCTGDLQGFGVRCDKTHGVEQESLPRDTFGSCTGLLQFHFIRCCLSSPRWHPSLSPCWSGCTSDTSRISLNEFCAVLLLLLLEICWVWGGKCWLSPDFWGFSLPAQHFLLFFHGSCIDLSAGVWVLSPTFSCGIQTLSGEKHPRMGCPWVRKCSPASAKVGANPLETTRNVSDVSVLSLEKVPLSGWKEMHFIFQLIMRS